MGQETSGVLASYLCMVADKCQRPESLLKCNVAAIGHYYAACGLPNPIDQDLRHLVSALTKSGTQAPVRRTKVMPCEPFYRLFSQWPDNEELPLPKLRLKAITLIALVTMARPSDLAPLAQVFNPETDESESVCFNTENLHFNEDGSLTITFFGTKNDSDRTGFEVRIPPSATSKCDPVGTLRVYMDRTSVFRTSRRAPVFIGLKKPHKALSNTSIAEILRESIRLAGLQGQGFTARSFRPTGATAAVKAQIEPSTVRMIGRWKNDTVFYERYVYPSAPKDYTDGVLSYKGLDNNDLNV